MGPFHSLEILLFWIISGTLAEYHVTFYLSEEKDQLSLVGDVATSSLIANNLTTEEFASLKYSFLDQNDYQSLFTINSDNGKLYTSVVIDRETECRFQEQCSLQFEVAAHSSLGSRFIIISVEVIIQDLNDNVPTFQTSTINRQISEAAIIGSPILLNEATDFDSTLVNRILSYDMVATNAPFTFSATSKSEGGFDLKLILNKTLDRENVDSYNVYIVAKDGGAPQNTGTLTVNIEVTDFNDNAPAFIGDSYNASIPENAMVGYSITKVVATDKDIGENGKVSYKLNPRQTHLAKIQKLFAVSETSGKISVKGSLEYESGKLFQIGIEASDNGQQPRTGHTTVKVTVLDVVNNSPQVKVNFLLPHNSGEVNISEASKIGTVIAHVTAEDVDSGLNGEVSCSISRGVFSLQEVP
ncbi:hypothetical protein FSP39_021988 [Pinctada imbricata]|uniref:Cadherin domain-containing protein n=1 Tax=Pinctada imbricata TaxID=66713 RepID=A0AA88Y8H0_PINIB|nr:hypothetical protein FSP39_021988 [Pinctada imbricata]